MALLHPEVFERVRGMRERLPRLAHLHPWWGEGAAVPLLDTTNTTDTTAAGSWSPGSGSDIAVVMFTSGTTGPSKGVAVSHRAVRTNAAQFGECHHIGAESVVLTHLPIVSPMHMNAAVRVGACQVLCPSPDIVASVRRADAHRATHYYSLPVRLLSLCIRDSPWRR